MKKKEKKFKLFTRGANDYIIFIVVMLLLALGIIMVLSASAPSSLSESGNSYKYVQRQVVAALVGLVVMFVLSTVDYRIYKKFKWIIYFGLVALLVLVGFIGIDAGGAKRWIIIAGFNFQPSEIAKLGFILFFAAILSDIKEKNKIKDIRQGCWYPIAFLFPIFFAIFIIQNHFSTTFIICMVTVVQMFIAGTRISHMIITALMAIPFLIAYIYKMGSGSDGGAGFRETRIQTWLDPFADPTSGGWQIIQSFYAIGSGGLFGVGLRREQTKIFIFTRTTQ